MRRSSRILLAPASATLLLALLWRQPVSPPDGGDFVGESARAAPPILAGVEPAAGLREYARVQATPSSTVTVVCDVTWQPIEGATVRLIGPIGRFAPDAAELQLGSTDARGSLRVDVVLRTITGEHCTLCATVPGFGPAAVSLPATDAAVTIRMRAANELRVRFVDPFGAPIPRVHAFASRTYFNPFGVEFRTRWNGWGVGSDPRAVVASVSDETGLCRLAGSATDGVFVFCQHDDHLALDPDWCIGGPIAVASSDLTVTMAPVLAAAARVVRAQLLRSQFADPATDGLPGEVIEALWIRKRERARSLAQEGTAVLLSARLQTTANAPSAARLLVTRVDGAGFETTLPYRPLPELLRDGAPRFDIPDPRPEDVAKVEVHVRSARGERLLGLPYVVERADAASPQRKKPFRWAPTDSVRGRSGDGQQSVLTGEYRARVAEQVAVHAESSTVRCERGQVQALTIQLAAAVQPCRIRLHGPDAERLGGFMYSIRDQQQKRVLPYVSLQSADIGDRPHFWLPSGNYTADVRVGDPGRRQVPFTIDASAGSEVFDVMVDTRP